MTVAKYKFLRPAVICPARNLILPQVVELPRNWARYLVRDLESFKEQLKDVNIRKGSRSTIPNLEFQQ
jgi:hypothetical protein